MLSRRGWLCQVLGLVGLGGFVGCSSKKTVEPTEDRLFQIGRAYLTASVQLRRGPRNWDELKPHLEGSVEELQKSPRDGEPFVILWGVDFMKLPPGPGEDPSFVGAYEKRGDGGKRYVLVIPVNVALMTDDELRHHTFPPGYKPPS